MNEHEAETEAQTSPFDLIDQAKAKSNPGIVLATLITHLESTGESRALLDALLLKARHDLGIPLIQVGSLAEIAEPTRTEYEDRYVAAIRQVGRRLLDAGDIAGAWPYFRAISEPEPVSKAIEGYEAEETDERLGQIVEIAFNQGAAPLKGFGFILNHYGTCSAISAFEGLPHDEKIRGQGAAALVKNLHDQLVASLRAEITRRGQPQPPAGASIAQLIQGRDWLFDDDAYHLDVSHLASVVRMSPLLSEADAIKLAIELTDYGRNLSERHRYDAEQPFQDTYSDHAAYLKGLLGDESAIEHFTTKVTEDQTGEGVCAQVLVRLLERMGKLDRAAEVAAEHLAGIPENILSCPGLSVLCQRSGKLDLLAKSARDRGDIVHYTAAILQTGQ